MYLEYMENRSSIKTILFYLASFEKSRKFLRGYCAVKGGCTINTDNVIDNLSLPCYYYRKQNYGVSEWNQTAKNLKKLMEHLDLANAAVAKGINVDV